MPQTLLQQTKDLCRRLEIIPTKSKGQNFLVSQEALDKIVAAANLGPEDSVLEIGPGLGILTEELVRRARRVVAVELDKKLFSWLRKKFKGVENLELVEGDIVKLLNPARKASQSSSCVAGRYQSVKLLGNGEYKVVANLPYQITSHILRLLLEQTPTTSASSRKIQRGDSATPPLAGGEIIDMTLMVQKEVGERICAPKGKMSILSVMVQYYSQPEMVAIVGRENFWPVPEVDSVVIHIKSKNQKNKKTKKQEEDFFKLVKIGFGAKRKMLKNNLRNVYEEQIVLAALAELGLNPKTRAEDLGVEEWIKLYQKLGDGCKRQIQNPNVKQNPKPKV